MRERLIAKAAQKRRENDLIEQELSGLAVTVAERAHIHEAIGNITTPVLKKHKAVSQPSSQILLAGLLGFELKKIAHPSCHRAIENFSAGLWMP